MKQFQEKAKFGDVREITAVDYVDEVNKAGKGVWVILHLYKTGYPLYEDIIDINVLGMYFLKLQLKPFSLPLHFDTIK